MRCLYCGNELALLKKLTGHGEFCSDAHRRKYQEQYSRLALTRLLQAHDQEPERPPLQLSPRPGMRARALQAGSAPRQLEAPAVQPSDFVRAAASPATPRLGGFLPQRVQPALPRHQPLPFVSPVMIRLRGWPTPPALPAASLWLYEKESYPGSGERHIKLVEPSRPSPGVENTEVDASAEAATLTELDPPPAATNRGPDSQQPSTPDPSKPEAPDFLATPVRPADDVSTLIQDTELVHPRFGIETQPSTTLPRMQVDLTPGSIAGQPSPTPAVEEAGPPPAQTSAHAAIGPQQSRPEQPVADLETLRLDMEMFASPLMPPSAASRRIAIVIALLVTIVLLGYLLDDAFARTTTAEPPGARLDVEGSSLVSGQEGWSIDWAGGGNSAFPGRHIDLFRPSLTMSDYRIGFQGRIGEKPLGWIFRAANPRNYYLLKLKIIDPGPGPHVVLSRAAVINGEENQRSDAELPLPVNAIASYQVRTDVWGSLFRTYVEDQLVDTWFDDRLKSGGFGLFRDNNELPHMHHVELHRLRLILP